MFDRLSDAVRARAEGVAGEKLRRIAAVFNAVPGVRAVRDGDRVVVEGRGLARRMIEDVRLRGGWR